MKIVKQLTIEADESTKSPTWSRTLFVTDNGLLMVPAVLAGREKIVAMKAAWDGCPMIRFKNHLFVPTEWLKKEFPKDARLLAILEEKELEVAVAT